jgi:cobalt/nickel transport system ATP-binding protein
MADMAAPSDPRPSHSPDPPGPEEILRLEGVHYRYPDGTEALRGIDLAVRARERVALLGPNGSGKTTAVLHLLGILRPSSGRVHVLGGNIGDGGAEAVRGRLGVLFQDPRDQLFLGRVRDDVAFGPANQGVRGDALDARVAEALAAVGLRDVGERASTHLSSGEQRRAALAAVLAMRPEVLVLDEPTANLDPSARRALARLLAGLELPLLVVTHDLPFALELCPRAVLMDAGTVVAQGATRDLLADGARMESHGMELPYGFHPERT